MDQHTAIVFVAIAIALLAGISLWLYLRHHRSRSLRERFGPEYDRVVRQEGNVRRGEGVLEFREKNVRNSKFVRSPPLPETITRTAGTTYKPSSWMIQKGLSLRRIVS